jgi:hypothetical protein
MYIYDITPQCVYNSLILCNNLYRYSVKRTKHYGQLGTAYGVCTVHMYVYVMLCVCLCMLHYI